MIAFVISLLLIIIVGILGKYTSIMSQTQFRFITISSILYIILLGLTMSLLIYNKGIIQVFMDNSTFIPLIFYILWFVSSASISKLFTGRNEYQGFFDSNDKYMSNRNIMPR